MAQRLLAAKGARIGARLYHPSNLLISELVPCLDMFLLEKNARVILTDSGSVTKRGFLLPGPVCEVAVETVEAGRNVLVGCDPERIYRAAWEARLGVKSAWPYGDGRAGERIVVILDSIL